MKPSSAPTNKQYASYDIIYDQIYDAAYGISFVFCDEDEAESTFESDHWLKKRGLTPLLSRRSNRREKILKVIVTKANATTKEWVC